MKIHTTNYFNTFIAIAEDCPAIKGEAPPVKPDKKTIANFQFDLISNNPYKYTSDEVLLNTTMDRNQVDKAHIEDTKNELFSKGQPCFRTSPLTKRYGWGIHFDENGKTSLYGCETDRYRNMISDKSLTHLKAMKSKK